GHSRFRAQPEPGCAASDPDHRSVPGVAAELSATALQSANNPLSAADDDVLAADDDVLAADDHVLTADDHTPTADHHLLTADDHTPTADHHLLTAADAHTNAADRASNAFAAAAGPAGATQRRSSRVLRRLPRSIAMSDDVTVVLPCLNEEESLPAVLAAIPAGYRALVVDNNSTDDTAGVASRHGAQVVVEPRAGYGSAVHAGVVAATTPIVAVIDADGSLDAGDLPRLVAALELGAD